jgi:hypothetical protein
MTVVLAVADGSRCHADTGRWAETIFFCKALWERKM